ncbi:type II toxin-antitoxin system RelE/ParE family toxin [Ralstonia pseudosolanacearum]|uniref:type II toxin-antitoxin system RelE/ParE family toxin n=1 Tax=Ralstonia pseudosolanacearum TaxID=1310165 RepID=UPI002E1CBD4E
MDIHVPQDNDAGLAYHAGRTGLRVTSPFPPGCIPADVPGQATQQIRRGFHRCTRTEWLDGLTDATVRGVVVARIKRLERGLMGDVEPVGEGVSELRIHIGTGWRVYFTQRGAQLVVLLVGGSKRTQKRDIKRAKALAARLD